MKRYGNLYPKVADINNIKQAIINASKGKTDRRIVQRILGDIDKYALEIQRMLLNHTFECTPYIEKVITDGYSQKKRTIKKPAFYPDQCVHWALMNICEPYFKKRMYQFSCSSIEGRGTFYAKDYIKGAMKDWKNTKYAYQLDIRKFYPSIDNEILKGKLARMFKDNDVLWLFGVIIDSDDGLPIGNYTSQWLANLYLTDLDMFIKHTLKVPYYVRYADDMLIFHSNKRKLQKARLLIEDFIANEKLEIKSNWKLYPTRSRPIDYCGFSFHYGHIQVRDYHYLRLKRRAKKIGKKPSLSLKNARYMCSQWGYIKHTDSFGFYCNDIKPYVDINHCKEVISNDTKKHTEN